MVQKMLRGATIQTFLRFFPMKEPPQERMVSLTDNGNTHFTPTIAKRSSQITLVCEKWTNKLSTVPSSFSQRKHPFAKALPFFKLSRVKTLPQEAFQAKKTHFRGNPRIPNELIRNMYYQYCLNISKLNFFSKKKIKDKSRTHPLY